MYFRITIPSLQDGKKDEAITFVKDKVMPCLLYTSDAADDA